MVEMDFMLVSKLKPLTVPKAFVLKESHHRPLKRKNLQDGRRIECFIFSFFFTCPPHFHDRGSSVFFSAQPLLPVVGSFSPIDGLR